MNGNQRDAICAAIDAIRPECHTELARLVEEIASHPSPGAAIKMARESVSLSRKLWSEDEDMEDADD